MPFDPAKPANNAPASSAEMRSQLPPSQYRHPAASADRDVNNAIADALPQTSNNSNGVSTRGIGADGGYSPSEMQDLINKVDEPINALRRQCG